MSTNESTAVRWLCLIVLLISLGALLPTASATYVDPVHGTSASTFEIPEAADDPASGTGAIAVADPDVRIEKRSIRSPRERTEGETKKSFDYDGDGLTNREESRLGTNMMRADSDGDGLSDRTELMRYGLSPTNPDTDGDGVPDRSESAVAPPLRAQIQTYVSEEPVDDAGDAGLERVDGASDMRLAELRSLHVDRQTVDETADSPETLQRQSSPDHRRDSSIPEATPSRSVTDPDVAGDPSTSPEQVVSLATRAEMTPLQVAGLALLGLVGLGAVAVRRTDVEGHSTLVAALPTAAIGVATPTDQEETASAEGSEHRGTSPAPQDQSDESVTTVPVDGPTTDDRRVDLPDRTEVTDDRRVEALLESSGGRLKQSTIVDSTEWSKAKVSRLLSSMEDEGRIRKVKVGRENLICLPGHEPDAVAVDGPE